MEKKTLDPIALKSEPPLPPPGPIPQFLRGHSEGEGTFTHLPSPSLVGSSHIPLQHAVYVAPNLFLILAVGSALSSVWTSGPGPED